MSYVTPFLLFSAFLLLLLISLSVPIIHTITLFNLHANVSSSFFKSGVNANVHFGLWGYCVSAVDATILGFGDTVRDAACSKRHLGYTFDSRLLSLLHLQNDLNVVSKTLTAALVLYPIACGLSFLALVLSFVRARRNPANPSRLFNLLALGPALLAALLSTIAFIVDLALVGLVKKRIKNATEGDLIVNWGNAVWMALGATIALWAACVGVCWRTCGFRRKSRSDMEKY